MIGVCLDTTITTTNCSRYTFRPFDYAPAQAVAFAPYLVKNLGKKWPNDPARQHAQALRWPLLAVVEQHLQPQTDAQERAVAERLEDDIPQSTLVQATHAVGHRALPGQHHSRRAPDHRGVGSDLDRAPRRDVRQRLGDRAQVAHSIVNDGDVGHRAAGQLTKGQQSSRCLLPD